MDYSAEERFVRSFVRKRWRERLLRELTTPARRHAGLDRFCHQAGELLDPDRIALTGKELENSAGFQKFLGEHGETCLILSPDGRLDGAALPLRAAVATAARGCDAAVILGGDYAVVFGEAGKGGRDRFLLLRPEKQ